MASHHDRLQRALNQLHAELSEMRKLDSRVAENLDSTIAAAQAVLQGQATSGTVSISERLRHEVLKYEASHPRLAASLGSIIDALAGMGI